MTPCGGPPARAVVCVPNVVLLSERRVETLVDDHRGLLQRGVSESSTTLGTHTTARPGGPPHGVIVPNRAAM